MEPGVPRAREDLAALEEKLRQLESEAKTDVGILEAGTVEVGTQPVEVSPRKSDIAVQELVLAWLPQ